MSRVARIRSRMRMNYRKEFVSPYPVPFVLPRQRVPGGSIVLYEEAITDKRPVVISTVFFLGAGIVFAFLLLTEAVNSSHPLFWELVLGSSVALPVGLLCFGFLWISESSAQQITCEGDTLEVVDAATHIDTVVQSGHVDEWRLILRQIVVKQKPFGTWKGIALSLELRDRYWIVLACQQNEELLEEWLAKAPAWLRRVATEPGEPWARQGTIRDYLSPRKRRRR